MRYSDRYLDPDGWKKYATAQERKVRAGGTIDLSHVPDCYIAEVEGYLSRTGLSDVSYLRQNAQYLHGEDDRVLRGMRERAWSTGLNYPVPRTERNDSNGDPLREGDRVSTVIGGRVGDEHVNGVIVCFEGSNAILDIRSYHYGRHEQSIPCYRLTFTGFGGRY